MKPITVLYAGNVTSGVAASLARLGSTGLVEEALLRVPPGAGLEVTGVEGMTCEVQPCDEPGAWPTVARLLDHVRTSHVLCIEPAGGLDPTPAALQRLLEVSRSTGAAIVYGDFFDRRDGGIVHHPLAGHQAGSIGDRFDMGPLVLWNMERVLGTLDRRGVPAEARWHTWYDLRLKASLEAPVVHLPEPLAVREPVDLRASGSAVFDYLLTGREQQIEAERVATAHLERLGARLKGPFEPFDSREPFPVEASVVIPVRDRVRTVGDAVRSALIQDASFPFNVLVVDNHSTDGTSGILEKFEDEDDRLFRIVPQRHDLGIGGCWNEAIFHPACGRYAVQLDSDDLYDGDSALAALVSALRDGKCGMAIGSYSTVDMDLEEIPPGLIDHREWSDDNGPNNALRIDGLGAPRAFATELVRQCPFPNVSYGEDYAVALRICREYRVGRIYESLYHCRRWEENTDADLPPDAVARHQTYKDRLRAVEIAARRELNRRRREGGA